MTNCVAGGTGTVTVRVREFEVPPPGVGLVTVIEDVPEEAMSAARMVAEIWVEEAKVVARGEPLILTTELETKLVPVTVRVKFDPPAVVEVGEMTEMVGTGLFTVIALLKAEVIPGDVAQILILSP